MIHFVQNVRLPGKDGFDCCCLERGHCYKRMVIRKVIANCELGRENLGLQFRAAGSEYQGVRWDMVEDMGQNVMH